ncbi:MAG: hypothetical protein U9O96_03800 [Candidatus Thermoplasmatota archaeon]|nr:hypothetical protein [Candidatus Thermoplasmatota archaeon]
MDFNNFSMWSVPISDNVLRIKEVAEGNVPKGGASARSVYPLVI